MLSVALVTTLILTDLELKGLEGGLSPRNDGIVVIYSDLDCHATVSEFLDSPCEQST